MATTYNEDGSTTKSIGQRQEAKRPKKESLMQRLDRQRREKESYMNSLNQ